MPRCECPGSRSTRRGIAVLVVAGAAAAAGALALAQRPGRTAAPAGEATAAGGLWVSASHADDGRQVMVVVDPALRTAAVYHVDAGSGAIALKSTRNLTWDLLVAEFNTSEPKPSAVRRMVEQESPPR